jgi:hypothetical protein
MSVIVAIPADQSGNKLFLKDLKEENNRIFVKYKSTYNDIPFTETEIYGMDGGSNYVITGEDGTVLWRFSTQWIEKLK